MFSGGLDSTVLLSLILKTVAPENLLILHINYGIRTDSVKDLEFVEQFCKKHQLVLFIKDYTELFNSKNQSTTALAPSKIGNIQGKARKIRYSEAKNLMLEHKVRLLVTGHHADDSIENYLLKQLKGQSTKAVEHIFDFQKPFSSDEPMIHLKPLIQFPKSILQKYAKHQQIPFVDDSSNSKNDYERNYLRNITFSQWDEKFPNWKNNLILHHQSMSAQSRLLQHLISKTQLVIVISPYLILSKEFWLLDKDFKEWLIHYYLNHLFPYRRFTRGIILEVLKKMGNGEKGAQLFEDKIGKIHYSHQLIGPMPKAVETVQQQILSHSDLQEKYFLNGHQKTLKSILSNYKIPSMGRQMGVFGVQEKSSKITKTKVIKTGFKSSLHYLQPYFKQLNLPTQFTITFDLNK